MGAGGWNINNKENNSKIFGMLYFDIDHGGKIKQGRETRSKGKVLHRFKKGLRW